MALFSKFKKAKEAAVEHKKTAAAQQAKPPSAPYKHVPTHAAQDALAAQPTTLKPDELQARIAKAKKRRTNSYQSPVTARHSVYHSCDSSRASSRTNSTSGFLPGSSPSSLASKDNSDGSINAIMRRSQSLSYRQSTPMTNGELQQSDYLSPVSAGRPAFPPPASQRPRPSQTMSSRSSFAKKKSPLSNVSVDEGSEEVLSNGSDKSAVSSQSFGSDSSDCKHRSVGAVIGDAATQAHSSENISISPQPVDNHPINRRSRWPIFPRKNIDIAAH